MANANNKDNSVSEEDLAKYTIFVDDIISISIAILVRVTPGDISCCLHTSNNTIREDHAEGSQRR